MTTGVAFNLAVRLRVAPDDVVGRGLYSMISPRMPPGMNVDPDQRLLYAGNANTPASSSW